MQVNMGVEVCPVRESIGHHHNTSHSLSSVVAIFLPIIIIIVIMSTAIITHLTFPSPTPEDSHNFSVYPVTFRWRFLYLSVTIFMYWSKEGSFSHFTLLVFRVFSYTVYVQNCVWSINKKKRETDVLNSKLKRQQDRLTTTTTTTTWKTGKSLNKSQNKKSPNITL